MKKKKSIWYRIASSAAAITTLGIVNLIWWASSDFGKTGWWGSHDTHQHLVLYSACAIVGVVVLVVSILMDIRHNVINKPIN